MWKNGYLKMKVEKDNDLIASDLNDFTSAAKKFANHALKLASLGFGTTFLEWVASIAAIYLLVLDRTNWRTNILTGLLVPYIFFSLPSLIFNAFRGDVGKWIAFVAVIIRLFFPKRFPRVSEALEVPVALIVLIVVAPTLFASTIRGSWIGVVICLAIACYLLQEHIRASGGFRNSFTQPKGYSNTVGIIILLVYPAWALLIDLL